jgi:hypothetical protein
VVSGIGRRQEIRGELLPGGGSVSRRYLWQSAFTPFLRRDCVSQTKPFTEAPMNERRW